MGSPGASLWLWSWSGSQPHFCPSQPPWLLSLLTKDCLGGQGTSLRCRAVSFSMGWCSSVSVETLGLLWDAGVHWPLCKAVWKLLVSLNYSYSSGDMALSEAFADLTWEPY